MATSSVDVVTSFYHALLRGTDQQVRRWLAPDFRCHASHPFNSLEGAAQFIGEFRGPLLQSLARPDYRPIVRVAGAYDGQELHGDGSAGDWVASTGYLSGTFVRPLLGIQPTRRVLHLRFAELIRIEADRIAEMYIILDLVDAMVQAGVCPLRRSLGHAGLVLPPLTMDGLHRPVAASSETARSVELVLDMLNGLGRFDGRSLLSMDQERYWHEDFLWFGPGGIGTTRGLEGFRSHHQGPFLAAFPTRKVDRTKCFVADGAYVATGGWPHMTAVHLGGGWLGMPPTGRNVTMRVMDFWRREGDLLRENWVSIDIPHILDQLGLDLFAQMREQAGERVVFPHDLT